jgi:hypothetical protein
MKPERRAIAVVLAATLGLIPVQLGWVPGLRHAWGMTLWQYLPPPAVGALTAGVLLVCVGPVRRLLCDVAASAMRRVPGPVVLVAVPVLLWLLRERRLYGDSGILLVNAASGATFLFPDVGATFLFRACMGLARALGTSGQAVVQVAVALAGGVAVATFHAAARELAPSPGRALLVVALTLGAGLTRVLAGHVEVYGFLLAATGTWLWASMAHLRGRVGLWVPSVAVGLVAWMHLSGIFLVPSLVVLACEGQAAGRVRRAAGAVALAAVPSLAFLVMTLAFGREADVELAVQTVLHWSGLVASPVGHEAFLRGWWSEAGVGTRYVALSPAHWKYLVNAFFVLAPGAFPLLAAFLVRAPRAFVATPEARMLSTACLALLAYTAIVRPVWGPYDWDLFSLTAAVAGMLAGHLLVTTSARRTAVDVGVLVVAVGVLMVTIPLLAVGIGDVREAGPFAVTLRGRPGETPEDMLVRQVGPWL